MTLLSARDIADRLGLRDLPTVRRLMREQMPFILIPGTNRLRVEESEFERWVNGNRKAPAPASSAARKPARPKPQICDLALFEPDGRIKRRKREA